MNIDREWVLHNARRVHPDDMWLDRWTALRMGFGLIWLSLTSDIIRIKHRKEEQS